MAALPPQVHCLLLHLQANGPLQVVDGDECPVDLDVALAAKKQGLISYSDGGPWPAMLG
jgi:hypothetical protein